jgi:hypothetical protein
VLVVVQICCLLLLRNDGFQGLGTGKERRAILQIQGVGTSTSFNIEVVGKNGFILSLMGEALQ